MLEVTVAKMLAQDIETQTKLDLFRWEQHPENLTSDRFLDWEDFQDGSKRSSLQRIRTP